MSILRPGSVFANRFAIDRIAGSGGMGTVYRAVDQATERTVALKLLHSRGSSKADTDRFLREAEILAALDHPAIVAHVAHGQTAEGDCYLAMEWLDGEDLAQRLERGAMSLSDTIALIRRIAETLTVLHERGIIHRGPFYNQKPSRNRDLMRAEKCSGKQRKIRDLRLVLDGSEQGRAFIRAHCA